MRDYGKRKPRFTDKLPRQLQVDMYARYSQWCKDNPSAAMGRHGSQWFLILKENGVGY